MIKSRYLLISKTKRHRTLTIINPFSYVLTSHTVTVCIYIYMSMLFNYIYKTGAPISPRNLIVSFLQYITWLPNTPMLQADETWSVPNQTAASRAGRESTNTWRKIMTMRNINHKLILCV